MRGETERQATLLLGLKPDGFVPKNHPLRRIKPLVDSALGRMSPAVRRGQSGRRTALDPARAPAQGEPADGLVYDPLGTPVLRATAVQHPVQVVPRPERGGRAVPRDDVHQESRTAVGGGPLFKPGAGCGAGAAQGCGARGPTGGRTIPAHSRRPSQQTDFGRPNLGASALRGRTAGPVGNQSSTPGLRARRAMRRRREAPFRSSIGLLVYRRTHSGVFFQIVEKTVTHCPDHHLLLRADADLVLNAIDGIANRERGVADHFCDLTI